MASRAQVELQNLARKFREYEINLYQAGKGLVVMWQYLRCSFVCSPYQGIRFVIPSFWFVPKSCLNWYWTDSKQSFTLTWFSSTIWLKVVHLLSRLSKKTTFWKLSVAHYSSDFKFWIFYQHISGSVSIDTDAQCIASYKIQLTTISFAQKVTFWFFVWVVSI